MVAIKSLCLALLAAALVTAACGSDTGGDQGVDANGPGQQGQGDEAPTKGKDKKDKKKDEKKEEAEEPPAVEGEVIRVRVAGGRVEGVQDTVSVPLGKEVTIVVSSDTADEVHVHGYDEFDDVGPGERAEIKLRTDIPGDFEVELESAHLLLFELRVQ